MTNNNLYVSLEEAISIFKKMKEPFIQGKSDNQIGIVSGIEGCIYNIQDLPTIDLGKIDEMIEEHNNKKLQSLNESFQSYSSGIIDGLQELKSRLFPKQ